jgi:hypothetical protein
MIDKLHAFLTANPFIEMMLQMMPPPLAAALREVRSALLTMKPGLPEAVVTQPVTGRSVSGVGVCLADLLDGTAQAGNCFRGAVRGGTLRAWNVVIGEVHGGEVVAVNLLLGAVRGGHLRAVNALIGDVHGGDLGAIGLVVGNVHGGTLRAGVLIGDVLGGDVVVQQHLGERKLPAAPPADGAAATGPTPDQPG